MNRSTESPMDFQWDNPVRLDPSSPFAFASMSHSLAEEPPKKRSHTQSTTESAIRRGNGNQGHAGNPFLFSTPNQIRNPAFSQFRSNDDATPSSTEADRFADSEGTPGQDQPPPKMPGWSTRTDGSHRTSDGVLRKVRRRREKRSEKRFWDGRQDERDDAIGSEEGDSDMEVDQMSYQTPSSWRDKHRDIPFIASSYLQLTFNIFLLLILLYLMFAFVSTIQRDVDQKVEEYSTEILQEMSLCSKEYLENRCDPSQRVPAMEKACNAWEKCMNRDPTVVGRARVSAETFAEIINSFIEPISYKTMIFCLMLVFGSLFVSNFAFGFLRAKAVDHPHPVMAAAIPPMVPLWDRHGHSRHKRASSRNSLRKVSWR